MESIIFYALFASQLLLMSYYFPRRIYQRMRTVFTTYTPAEYPKLYPKPESYYERMHARYRLANQVLLTLGFAVWAAMLISGFDLAAKHAQMVPWAVFMLQMTPQMALELTEYKQMKLMRQSDQRTTRKADLSPRRIFDLVPRSLVLFALVWFVVLLILDAAINDFDAGFGTGTFYRGTIVGLTNVGFAFAAWWLVYGKKYNPYQSSAERSLQAKAAITSMLYVSIGMSLYMFITEFIDTYELEQLSPAAMTLYCQLIATVSLSSMLKTLQLGNLDFDVYRKDPQTA